jgi:flagellar basal-body rod protein FlgB
MFDSLEIFRMAYGLARHSGARQSVVARNIANANTPGYQAQDVAPFAQSWNAGGAEDGLRRTRAGHLLPGEGAAPRVRTVQAGTVAPNGNAVSIETETLKSAELRQQHDMALAVYRSALTVLRTSLGRS